MAARKDDHDDDTIEHMAILAKSMVGSRMGYRDLVARNGLPNQACRPKRRPSRRRRPSSRSARPKETFKERLLTLWIPLL